MFFEALRHPRFYLLQQVSAAALRSLCRGTINGHHSLKCSRCSFLYCGLQFKSHSSPFCSSCHTMYTREGFTFSPLPFTKVAPSLSHSPLPVLPIFELHGAIRHKGAVYLGSRIKKTQLSTTAAMPHFECKCHKKLLRNKTG